MEKCLEYSILYRIQRDLYSVISQSFSGTDFHCKFPREGRNMLHFQRLFDHVNLLLGTSYSSTIA